MRALSLASTLRDADGDAEMLAESGGDAVKRGLVESAAAAERVAIPPVGDMEPEFDAADVADAVGDAATVGELLKDGIEDGLADVVAEPVGVDALLGDAPATVPEAAMLADASSVALAVAQLVAEADVEA